MEIRHTNMDKSILNISKNIFWHPTYVNFFDIYKLGIMT